VYQLPGRMTPPSKARAARVAAGWLTQVVAVPATHYLQAAQTGWKFQMHNRMWADDNVYATQNGGSYKFIVEPQEKLAIPDEQALWDDLMSNKTQHGIPLHVYEQDWMYNEWQGLNATRQSPTLSRQWLMQVNPGQPQQHTGTDDRASACVIGHHPCRV
jgi:hypothetical protein